MQNHHCRFDWHYIGQIYGGDFAKFCGLLRIYELYLILIESEQFAGRAAQPKKKHTFLTAFVVMLATSDPAPGSVTP